MSAPDLPSPAALRERLAALRAGRGYVLAHRGALEAAAPDLHAAYAGMYAALTLTDRHLDAWEREFVWLLILVAAREPVGTHHVDLFRKAGGTTDQVRTGLQLVGYAGAAQSFPLVADHWSAFFPDLDARVGYMAGIDRLSGGSLPSGAVHLGMAAVHTLLGQPWGVEAHLRAIYGPDGPRDENGEERMVEAMSLVMWPAGVNPFVHACTLWHALIRSGELPASPRFRAWGETEGVGPFSPAGRGA